MQEDALYSHSACGDAFIGTLATMIQISFTDIPIALVKLSNIHLQNCKVLYLL